MTLASVPARTRTRVLLALCCLLAAALRLAGNTSQSFWLDEAYTFTWASLPLSDLWTLTRADVHPPFYFVALHGILPIGDGPAYLRGFSAFWGVATIPLVYAVGAALHSTRLGLLAALLLAISPWHVAYGQEARMYTMLTFWSVLVMYGLVMLLRPVDPSRGGGADSLTTAAAREGPKRQMAWAAVVFGTAAALWTHDIAGLLAFTANLVVLVWGLRRQVRIRFLGVWCLAQVAVVALWSPWLAAFLSQASSVYAEYWIQPSNLADVMDALRLHYGVARGSLPPSLLAIADIGALALAALGAWEFRKGGWALFVFLFWLTPFVTNLLVSQWRPIFIPRTLLWSSVPFYLLIAAGIAPLRLRGRTAALVAATAFSATGLWTYHRTVMKEGWREASAFVASHAAEDDLILFQTFFTELPFNYYFRHEAVRPQTKGLPNDASYYLDLVLRRGRDFRSLPFAVQPADLTALASEVARYRRVWFVSSGYAFVTDPRGLVPCVLGRLGSAGEPIEYTGVSMYRYDIRASSLPAGGAVDCK